MPPRCSICKVEGHIKSNRKFHPRKEGDDKNDIKIVKQTKTMEDKTKTMEVKIKNRGTGAGGKNTNVNGLNFEKKTMYENFLEKNYIPFTTHMINGTKNKYITFETTINGNTVNMDVICQQSFRHYMKNKYNIDNIFRNPDEAFVWENNGVINIQIIEKKNQNCEGSVETKLWASPSLKREYEIIISENDSEIDKNIFNVQYSLCISKYLNDKYNSEHIKYKILKKILSESKIKVMNGDEENYFEILNQWIKE